MTEQQRKDIEWYEKKLEKVKSMHDPKKSTRPWVCEMYIEHAESQLNAVKNGLSPFKV